MTAGADIRPVTASGSIRTSDVQHHRNLRTAEMEAEELQRRAARTLVLEEIEDFEHKLGWKMRKNLGPRWEEKRYLEVEEERTMGLKKSQSVRPPSPVDKYDYAVADHNSKYGPVTPRSPNSLTVANNSPRWGASMYGTGGNKYFGSSDALGGALGDWAPFDRPATGYESARNVFIVTRRSQREASRMASPANAGGRGLNQVTPGQRPWTQGSRPGTTQSYGTNTRRRLMCPMRGVATSLAGKSNGRMELWTAQSMLEPIFLPASATQRVVADQAPPLDSISQRIERTGNARRWEDGPGRHFWQVQEKNLRAAIRRTEGSKLRSAQQQGAAWKGQHDAMVEQLAAKHDQAVIDARRRSEYYPRAKIFAEERMREEMKQAWERREKNRLGMGMSRRDVAAEASVVADETANFDARLAKIQKERAYR